MLQQLWHPEHARREMGTGPGHNNKGKRGHKLSHKTARRIKSALAPPDLMWEAFHAPQEIKVRCALGLRCRTFPAR